MAKLILLTICVLLTNCKNSEESKEESLLKSYHSILASKPTKRSILLEDSYIAGSLGAVIITFESKDYPRFHLLYFRYTEGKWEQLERVDVWSNSPYYPIPRKNNDFTEALYTDADNIDKWVTAKLKKANNAQQTIPDTPPAK
jgi:hypothetical protein